MLVKKINAVEIKNSKGCEVWEYNYPSKLFSFATAFINGRYPEVKRVVNLECEEIYYVLSGFGVIHSEKGNFEIKEGDLYFFEKSETYWIEGNKLSLVLVNVPKWLLEQHKIVD
ncbi:MAG: cupin domain-containing protein [Candidatus Uhrbacteria bacterium]